MEPAVRAEALVKEYRGGVRALDGIDLEVGPGEVLGLLGRNGSGKTTTVRILTGLTPPTSGRATVLGVSVADEPDRVQPRIGVTMQEAALDDAMTGREHLTLVAGLWGMARAERRRRCRELLERFGLAAAADRRIGTYSGGMRRRLDIATALVGAPEVLFLDEPTTGLDPQSRRALWEEIRTLRRDGAAVLLTTQYLAEAEALTDRVVVLDAGRILTEGTAAALKRRHGRTEVVVHPELPGDRERVLALVEGADLEADAIRISLPAADGAVELVGELHAARIPLARLEVRESSLEDVFVELTGRAI